MPLPAKFVLLSAFFMLKTSAAQIHCKLCAAVYVQNVISEGTARQRCRMFKDRRTNVHDEEQSGQPSVVSDDIVPSVDQEVCERQRSTIPSLLCKFQEISLAVLYKITTVRLGYHNFCTRWVPKMFKKQRMALPSRFLGQYHIDGDEFLSHHVQVTGDETWVSFVNVETKEQSKQWMHTYPPNKPKQFKQMLSACQKANGNCFQRQERSSNG
jgi:hypothetical protein